MKNKWFEDGRFRIPIWWNWALCIPQPRWLKRWYYKKSYQWWDHPSNHHWKGWCIGDGLDCFVDDAPIGLWRWWRKKKMLLPGERDLWSGSYRSDPELDEKYDLISKYYRLLNVDYISGKKSYEIKKPNRTT